MSLDSIPGLAGLKKEDVPNEVVTYGKTEDVMADLLYKMGKNLKRAAAIVVNSFEEMEQDITQYLKSNFPIYLNIGPFTNLKSSFSNDCISWLNTQKSSSVIYVSFGSVIVPPPDEIKALAEALEECNAPFLWSFRGDTNHLLPQGFIERNLNKGKITQWVPQVEVLRHDSVGVFVTHGGWNSVMETVTGGVPMICRPFFGDQKLNKKMMEDFWGIGIGIDVVTKEGLIRVLNKVLFEEEGKVMRGKIGELKKLSVEACEPGGSSQKCFMSFLELLI